MIWVLICLIFLVGLWGVTRKANMVKKVMSLSIANSGIILLFVHYASLSGVTAPIEGSGRPMADPLPQALMLTAIVVGVCVMALALVLVYRLYQRFGTLDMHKVELGAWKLHD